MSMHTHPQMITHPCTHMNVEHRNSSGKLAQGAYTHSTHCHIHTPHTHTHRKKLRRYRMIKSRILITMWIVPHRLVHLNICYPAGGCLERLSNLWKVEQPSWKKWVTWGQALLIIFLVQLPPGSLLSDNQHHISAAHPPLSWLLCIPMPGCSGVHASSTIWLSVPC